MKKNYKKSIVIAIIILIAIIFTLDIWRRSYQEKRTIMTYLHSVALYINTYKNEHKGTFPSSLDFIDSKLIPENIITRIKYTYLQRKAYSVNIPQYDYSKSDLWFYFPYEDEAWVCMDGGVLVNKIPLSDIKYNIKDGAIPHK